MAETTSQERGASDDGHDTSPSTPDAPEVEDGGFWGWLQVAGAAALYFNHL